MFSETIRKIFDKPGR